MRRLVLLLLAFTLLVGLAGCSRDEPVETSQPPATDAPPETEPPETEPPETEPPETPSPTPEPTPSPSPSPTPSPSPSPTATVVYYQVRCGSFADKADADALAAEIHSLDDTVGAGYKDAYVAKYDGSHTVICGTFYKAESAEKVVDDLKAKGYDAHYRTLSADGQYVTVTPSPSPTSDMSYFQVQVAGFSSEEDANAARDSIRALEDKLRAGYAGAYTTGDDGSFAVVCGTFAVRPNAQKVVDDLKTKGFDAKILEY